MASQWLACAEVEGGEWVGGLCVCCSPLAVGLCRYPAKPTKRLDWLEGKHLKV